MKELKNPEFYMKKLDITYEEALELMEFDGNAEKILKEEKKEEKKSKPKAKPQGIQSEDLEYMKKVILENFSKEQVFQNKEFAKLVYPKFTNRQTPSRLKKLVEQGFLSAVAGQNGKVYQRVE